MTSISLPDPVVRHGGPPPADAGALERDLRQRVDGEVRFDAGSRGLTARTRRTTGKCRSAIRWNRAR